MQEPRWISLKLALAIHDEQLALYGGLPGVRDMNLLESGMSRPRQMFCYGGEEPSLIDLSALYVVGVARNHPFLDANKRTAFVLGLTFLGLNGVKMNVNRPETVLMMLAVAQGEMDETALADWLRTRAV